MSPRDNLPGPLPKLPSAITLAPISFDTIRASCHTCKIHYPNMKHLQLHVELFHGHQYEFLGYCGQCPRLFTKRKNFQKHIWQTHMAEITDSLAEHIHFAVEDRSYLFILRR